MSNNPLVPPNPFGTPGAPQGGRIKINTSNPALTGQLADGTYQARLSNIEDSFTKLNKPCIILTFSVWTTPGGRDTKDVKMWLLTNDPNAMWKTTQSLGALGLYEMGKDVDFTPAEALNRLCILSLKNQPGRDGRVFLSVESVFPWPEGVGQKWSPAGAIPGGGMGMGGALGMANSLAPAPVEMSSGIDFSKHLSRAPIPEEELNVQYDTSPVPARGVSEDAYDESMGIDPDQPLEDVPDAPENENPGEELSEDDE